MSNSDSLILLRQRIKQSPIVSLLITLSFLGWLLLSIDFMFAVSFLSFQPEFGMGSLRYISPIFLHFGLIHLAFNCLWLALLGEKIETHLGSIHLLLVVIVTAIISNYSQFYWSGSSNFGGMSGVVYALLGYLWAAARFTNNQKLKLPAGIFGFMIGWLFLCMTPIIPFVFGSGIANAAHLGGLLSGMILGFIFSFLTVK